MLPAQKGTSLTDLQNNGMMRLMATDISVTDSDDFDAPATKSFVRYEIANLRTAMVAGFGALREELFAQLGSSREEMKAGDEALRLEIRAVDSALRLEIRAVESGLRLEMGNLAATLRQEIQAVDSGLRQEIQAVRLEMASMQKSLLKWFVASQAATITVIATLVASLRA